ncbi:hypothetical protein DITRI_Ditri13aG0153400 [Diplodiscus trichospermus]
MGVQNQKRGSILAMPMMLMMVITGHYFAAASLDKKKSSSGLHCNGSIQDAFFPRKTKQDLTISPWSSRKRANCFLLKQVQLLLTPAKMYIKSFAQTQTAHEVIQVPNALLERINAKYLRNAAIYTIMGESLKVWGLNLMAFSLSLIACWTINNLSGPVAPPFSQMPNLEILQLAIAILVECESCSMDLTALCLHHPCHWKAIY